MRATKYTIEDLKKQFPTNVSCLSFIFDSNHSRDCSCGGVYRPLAGRKQFQCSKCRFQIAPTAGTIFHKSDTPLTLWFHAIWVFSNAKSGISAKEMERQLGVTYKCAWRILSQIKKALNQGEGKLSGEVETDAGFFGGKVAQKDKSSKPVIMAAIQRNGTMKATVVENTGGGYTEEFVKKNVTPKSILYTDLASSYIRMQKDYRWRPINHGKTFAKGKRHINHVESFFSHMKRSIKGTFKSVSKKHLQSYLDAFVFHRNNNGNDRERFSSLMGMILRA